MTNERNNLEIASNDAAQKKSEAEKTAAEKAEEAKREKEREEFMKYKQDDLFSVFTWERVNRQVDPKPSSHPEDDIDIEAGGYPAAMRLGKIQDGTYRIAYKSEFNYWAQGRDTQNLEEKLKEFHKSPGILTVMFFKGVIKPAIQPDHTDPIAFQRAWQQIMRLYMAGTGTRRLVINMPGAKGREDNIKLSNIERMLKMAIKEKAAVFFGEEVETALAIASAKGGKHALKAQKLRDLQLETVRAMQSDPRAKQIDAKQAHSDNIESLNKESNKLKELSEKLKDAKPDEIADKIKELEAQRDKVDKALGKIEEDVGQFGANSKTCGSYENIISSAKLKITDAETALKNADLQAKVAPHQEDFNKVKTGISKLNEKAELVRKAAGVNTLSAAERSANKTKSLTDKEDTISKALTALQGAPAGEKAAKLEALEKALKEVNSVAQDMLGEPSKEDAKAERNKYVQAMEKLQGKLNEVNAAIERAKTDPDLTGKDELINRLKVLADKIQAQVNFIKQDTRLSFDKEKAEAELKKDAEEIKNAAGFDEQLNLVGEHVEALLDGYTSLHDGSLELEGKSQDLNSNKPEDVVMQYEELIQQKDILEKRREQFAKYVKNLNDDLAGKTGPEYDQYKTTAVKLNEHLTKISEFIKPIDESLNKVKETDAIKTLEEDRKQQRGRKP